MPTTDIFCRVIDNYGDAGIAWRLAADLAQNHDFIVRLFIDDVTPITYLAPDYTTSGIQVLPIADANTSNAADLVIETLGADIPEAYLNAMTACVNAGSPPVWIYYEYLTAEDWVLDAHLKPSPHPRLPLTRHFFYPGFKAGTGGLLSSHITPAPVSRDEALRVFMFTYDNDNLAPLAKMWAEGPKPVQLDLSVGAQIEDKPTSTGALTVRSVPFMCQTAFDVEITCHDVLFIRGEDSLTQAISAGKPVIWHIYPQDEGAHLIKLRAFLAFFTANWDDLGAAEAFSALNLAWNGENHGEIGELWVNYHAHLPTIAARAQKIASEISKLGSATQNLVDFWAKLR